MQNTLAPASAVNKEQASHLGHPGLLAPVDQVLAAALLELDLDASRGQGRPFGPPTNITARGELAATKRANRSTLNQMAASLGISRSKLNGILEEPALPTVGRQLEPIQKGGDGKRHDHGTGRRRHAGAGRRRHARM